MSRALLLLLAWSLLCPAEARHTAETPATDYTAYTLPAGELRLGLSRFEVGVTDRIQLGTYPLFWLIRVRNILAKVQVYQDGPWTVSAFGGYFSVNLKDFSKAFSKDEDSDVPDVTLYSIPLYLTTSYRTGNFTFSVQGGYSATGLSGDIDNQDLDLEGAGVASTGTLSPSIEYRTSETFAWVMEARMLLFQKVDASIGSTTEIDDRTTLTLYGDGGVETPGVRGNVVVSGLWSWDVTNLRLGLGYGHYDVPVVRFFSPTPTVIPEFDLFWVF